ncbi:hypothetical protein CU313_05585 [Prochlorococcus marinus str. MU1404]|uniref:type II secretion system protein GspD n=1 Tax=Prochlorococcus marinus TaxID=1219 RepID=UPI001ADC1673|nr:secretin N-terminal domain-containing protein [Prochlorococcus marinus]MBO8229876.1 hypothetical protein [Prochlorococcus marinus XMU1404]MBW3073339.1 hypothetical protein [Prochlorococcus marinus str. MU1404]MCR8545788.1 hypothetical protein [Prochlorococcus marinus CUG1432]
MKRIYSLLLIPISILSFSYISVYSEEILNKNELISQSIKKSNNLVLKTDSSNDQNIDILLSGIGENPQITKNIKKDLISINIKTENSKYQKSFQSLSIPSVGIKTLTLSGNDDIVDIVITPLDEILFSQPELSVINDTLKMTFPKQSLPPNILTEENIFSVKPLIKAENNANISRRASAPPLGDIAVGTTYIPNLKTVKLEGPNVSMVFEGATAKSAIEFLISKTNYGYVWVQQDPTFDANKDKGSDFANSNTFNITSEDGPGSENEKVSDSPRYITLTIKDKPFSVAFNSILMSSGLEAKLENGIVYVGPDVQDRIFSERISRIYRLNQTTANAAASYLANLGAKVTQTNTITTAVTSGASQSQSVSGAASSATTTQESTTSVRSYGGNAGPLLGLIATTDDRLQTITLIGNPDLIKVAETYIKQLDLRQRQVALTVRILDVNISDGTTLDNSWAFRQGNKFIVNAGGKLLGTVNSITPPTEANFGSAAATNNSGTFPNQTFIDLLRADIASKDTKIIANPTLILNEFPGSTGGDTVTFSSVNDTLKAGTIGRSYGNEAFVIVGTQVPINCTFDPESSVATLEYGIAGLTFGARISRIDDNGYVTFSISPAISSKSEQRLIENCATVDLLATRRLDSGSIRVKDGNTLILTGVLDSTENETVTKWPILGDLPIIGQIFRKTVSSKDKRELVILVTPQILNSLESDPSEIGYKPNSEEAKEFIKENSAY